MKYNVWIPTGEMWCYEVEAESPEQAKEIILDKAEKEDNFWNSYNDYFYADVTSADWEIEEAPN